MGTNNIVMLSVFDRSFFPSAFGSRHMSPFHGNEDMFLGLPGQHLREESWRAREPTFAGLEAQREKFLNEMNEQNEQGDGMSQLLLQLEHRAARRQRTGGAAPRG